MSLLKRQQEKARIAAEESARLAEEKKLRNMAVHPLVKEGCNRDVRDGYFYGLLFAAIADDDKIDKNEKSILTNIACSLNFPVAEVNDAIEMVTSLVDDKKVELLQECIATIKDCELGIKLFYAQFMLLWTSHEHDAGELDEYLRQFVDKTGVAFPTAKRHSVVKVLEGEEGANGALFALAEWMGDDALKYFAVKKYGDVSEILERERKRQRATEVAKKRKEEARIEAVRKEFASVINRISEDHRLDASLHNGWDDCLRDNLSAFSKKDIDWVSACSSRLRELQNYNAEKAIFMYARRKTLRRKLIWKLMCMQFVYEKEVVGSDINNMLRAAAEQSDGDFRQRIENFIRETFADDVELQ